MNDAIIIFNTARAIVFMNDAAASLPRRPFGGKGPKTADDFFEPSGAACHIIDCCLSGESGCRH